MERTAPGTTVEVDPGASPFLASQLLRLQREAYAVEARIIGDDGIPPLHETLEELRDADLTWLVVLDGDGVPVAATAFTGDERVVDIDRLVVDPAYARRGLGAGLVVSVLTSAAATDRSVTVSTARDNLPARRLYEQLGFTHVTDVEPERGLWVSSYRWRQRRAARVLCLDAAGCVLLLRWRDPADGRLLVEPPGGGLEDGESAREAAARELHEETGLPRSRVTARSVVVPRDCRWNGRRVVAVEPFFLARLPEVAPPVQPQAFTAVEEGTYAGHAWVSPGELAWLDGELQPPGLAAVLADLTVGG